MQQAALRVLVEMLCVDVALKGRNVRVALYFKRIVIGVFAAVGGHVLELGHRHIVAVVHVPVFLWGAEGQMGFLEAYGKEERLVAVLELLQRLYGLLGYHAVLIGYVGHVGALRGHTAVGEGIGVAGRLDVRHTPRLRVVLDVLAAQGMVYLAHADSLVSVVLEGLRHGDDVGIVVAERPHQPPNARMVGIKAGEEARARGSAEGNLAVGVVEHRATVGEAAYVWRACQCVAVRRQPWLKVVYGDEEHVWAFVIAGLVGRV